MRPCGSVFNFSLAPYAGSNDQIAKKSTLHEWFFCTKLFDFDSADKVRVECGIVQTVVGELQTVQRSSV